MTQRQQKTLTKLVIHSIQMSSINVTLDDILPLKCHPTYAAFSVRIYEKISKLNFYNIHKYICIAIFENMIEHRKFGCILKTNLLARVEISISTILISIFSLCDYYCYYCYYYYCYHVNFALFIIDLVNFCFIFVGG